MKQYILIAAWALLGPSLHASETPSSWIPSGWGGGAYYFATVWHPREDSVIYMGGDCTGIYRSDTKGKQWQFINKGLTNYAVYCLAVSPASPDLIYALTDGGLHKSSDRGENWEFIAASAKGNLNIVSKRDGTVRAVCIDPKVSSTVYSGSRTGRLWKTTDDGETWKELNYLGEAPKKWGVLSSVAIAEDGVIYASNTKHGVFRSTDGGDTWESLSVPKTAYCVSVTPGFPKRLWAACDKEGGYRSNDGGDTWKHIDYGSREKLRVREIASAPRDAQRVYSIAAKGWSGVLYSSADGGTTWKSTRLVRNDIKGNPTNPDDVGNSKKAKGYSNLSSIKNITVNPQNPNELFIAGNWRNVFSGDAGATLEERAQGSDNTVVTDIQFFGETTYVTAMDEGLLVSENRGKEWKQLHPRKYVPTTSGHFWRVRVAEVDGAVRIVTTASPWNSSSDPNIHNQAYYSNDGGTTFHLGSEGLPTYVPIVNTMWGRSYPRSLVQHPTDPNILYLGMGGDPEPEKNLPGGGIFRSADGGKTWTRCASQPGGLRLFYGLVVDPTNPKRLYYTACGKGGGAWKSEDEGATWTHVFKNETWCFNVDITPTGRVLVGGKNLWSSHDHGATWKQITTYTDSPSIVGIAVDPENEKRIWISRVTWDGSSQGGIYRTTDGGANWEDITVDTPYRKPLVLRYNETTKELWAGGAGIFRIQQ